MPFVLDSSVALAWVLPDEASADAERIETRLASDSAVVPAVWPLEVVNALLTASRRARIDEDDVRASLAHLQRLPIEVENANMTATFDAVTVLAAKHGLTSYDAAYLELGKRRNLPLATLDRKLREVCAVEGLHVLP